MTVTDTPSHRTNVDETQVLFEEAKQRRRRRWLLGGIASFAFAIFVGIVIGLVAIQGGGRSPRPVGHPVPPPSATAVAGADFAIRPVLCYAPPYAVPLGQNPSTGPLPTCSPASQLTAANLDVTPASNNVDGFTSTTNIDADPQFATYPSTTSSSGKQSQVLLLPGTSASGPGRFVLGPAGLTRSAIATAHANDEFGQWTVLLRLTPNGSAQWDALAARQFHAIVGVVVNGQVVSTPITQPSQQSFTSFDGQLQIASGITEHQAKVIASEL